MAITVGLYQDDDFNSLLDFSDAGPVFDSLDGAKIIQAKMMPLFRGHGVEHDLGLALLHRHFELNKGERLTDIRGTSVPLMFETGNPSLWALGGDKQDLLRPLEFSIENIKAPQWNEPKFQAFLQEFAQVLQDCGARGIFGLRSYPGYQYPGCVEFTAGRTNVNLTPVEVSNLLALSFRLYLT